VGSLTDATLYATIAVSDLARAKTFYGSTLELKLKEEIAEASVYECGGGCLLQVYTSQYAGTSQSTVATLEVRNLDATMAELRGRGVTFEEYDTPDLKTTDGVFSVSELRGSWFKDSDGNILSLVQRG